MLPRAIDTNVLVRLLVDDGSPHRLRTSDLVGTELFVPITVVLETEWVIRKGYGADSARVETLFRLLLDFPGVTISDRSAFERALDLMAGGMDFADALHLVLSTSCGSMLTFDKAFIRCAKFAPDLPRVREP